MARRVRQPEKQPQIVSAGLAPEADVSEAFTPLDTGWIDDIEEDPDESFAADLPEPDSEPDLEPAAESDREPEQTLTARSVTDLDVDRLWDWVRADEDRGLTFLGFQPKTARDVYGHFAQHFTDTQRAAAFAIDEDGSHIGFVLLNPLDVVAARAVVHLYLAPSVRGRLTDLSIHLLRLCDTSYPTLTLMVVTPDESRMRLYRQAGFAVTYLLTRAPGGG